MGCQHSQATNTAVPNPKQINNNSNQKIDKKQIQNRSLKNANEQNKQNASPEIKLTVKIYHKQQQLQGLPVKSISSQKIKIQKDLLNQIQKQEVSRYIQNLSQRDIKLLLQQEKDQNNQNKRKLSRFA